MRTGLRAALTGVVAGAVVGGAVRLVSDAALAPERSAVALTVWLVLACVVGGALGARSTSRAAALRTVGLLALGALAGGIVCSAVARGSADGWGAVLVPAACGVLSALLARTARIFGLDRAEAVFPAVAVPLILVGFVFVADPYIEWNGSTPASPDRARRVLRANPLAALTSVRGGAGVDWLAAPLMYDGPAGGGVGLSLIGQYYPSPPPSPFGFGALVLGLAGTLLLLPGRWAGTLCPWRPSASS